MEAAAGVVAPLTCRSHRLSQQHWVQPAAMHACPAIGSMCACRDMLPTKATSLNGVACMASLPHFRYTPQHNLLLAVLLAVLHADLPGEGQQLLLFGGCQDQSGFLSLVGRNYVQTKETWGLDLAKLRWGSAAEWVVSSKHADVAGQLLWCPDEGLGYAALQ